MTPRIEVHLEWDGELSLLGHLRRTPSRGAELVSFAYAQ